MGCGSLSKNTVSPGVMGLILQENRSIFWQLTRAAAGISQTPDRLARSDSETLDGRELEIKTLGPESDDEQDLCDPVLPSCDGLEHEPVSTSIDGQDHCEQERQNEDCVDLQSSIKLVAEYENSNKAEDEEKRAKEAQKKFKKKEKASGTSTSGVSLEDFPTALENPNIPQFVYKCVSYIEAEGMKTEGLYRIPGNKAQGELFVNKFAVDPNVDISTLEIPVNAIATLLKSFFSDLSEALIPEKLCDELMEAAEMTDKSSRLLMLRGVIKKLPLQNFEVLKYIISHLFKVSQNHEFNSMNSRNLAKCWWPTLIRLQFKSYEKLIQGSQVPEDIVQNLIEQCAFFFHGGNEV
ncbi:rho GTPase-activating protein 5 [Biomphalaria glabrata]|nr:rho GTPase-activating protein 5 [Biomphalaria glabrata]